MTYIFKKFVFLILSFLCINVYSQDITTLKYTDSNKGKFLISWGGNRESFSKSDITFKGNDYNFTIKDATAKDKPKGWHVDYINPTRMTIPQTNIKIGYYLSDHYLISIGVDHMKYVMDRNKLRELKGFINLPEDQPGAVFNNTFDNEVVFVSEDLLKFEHTNGLNYVYIQVDRVDDISFLFNIHNTDKFQVNISEGLGAGLLYPKTNTTLLLKERYDEFHVSGYGISLSTGLNLIFFKHFFVEADLKGGYIDMPNIRTTSDAFESAAQHFFYLQRIISLGTVFRI